MMIGPLVAVLAQPVWGYFSDRYSLKKTIRSLWILTIACSVGLFVTEGYGPAFTFVLLLYFFMLPWNPLLDSLLYQSATRFGRSYGSIRLWGSLGFFVTAIITGALLPYLGGVPNIKWMYWTLGVMPLVLLIFVQDEKPAGGKQVTLQAMLALLSNRRLLWFLVLVFLLTVPHRMNDALFGLHMLDLGASAGTVSAAWAVAACSEMLGFALIGRWAAKYNELALLGLAACMYTLRWAAYALTDSPSLLLLFQASHSVTFAVFWIVSVQYVVRMVPPELRSTGQSLLSAVFLGLAGIAGGSLGGWMKEMWGGGGMYWMGAGFTLLAAVLFFVTQALQRK